MIIKIKLTLFIWLIFTTYLSAQHDPFQESIDVQKADSIMKVHINSDHPFIIIDLRTEGEYASGYIEGASNLNYFDSGFDDTLTRMDKNKEYLIYCASGGRSAGAFSKMKSLDFKMVYNMIGGINAWKSAGFPVVTGTGIDVFANRPAVVKIYPNPITSESKFILLDSGGEHVSVKVISMTGRLVEEFEMQPGDYHMPDFNNITEGLYFYQVYLNNELIQTEKFIKTR